MFCSSDSDWYRRRPITNGRRNVLVPSSAITDGLRRITQLFFAGGRKGPINQELEKDIIHSFSVFFFIAPRIAPLPSLASFNAFSVIFGAVHSVDCVSSQCVVSFPTHGLRYNKICEHKYSVFRTRNSVCMKCMLFFSDFFSWQVGDYRWRCISSAFREMEVMEL